MKKVNILISIYNPNEEFLIKQLQSLDGQDYDNIEILIWDDNPCSAFDTGILERYIQNHSYSYKKGNKNLGYAKAFEKLTYMADGEYVAYCDQDDIWMKNKISVCVNALESENAVLVTSDRAVIDENDNILIASDKKESPNICNGWKSGEDITAIAVFNTCAIGMNIVMNAAVAKSLMPLPDKTAHDKWLTAGASVKGKVLSLEDTLVQYRRHGKNVSGVLNGITCKEDYYTQRVEYSDYLAKEFLKRFPEISEQNQKVINGFCYARVNKKILKLYKYRWLSPQIVKFEMLLPFVPNVCFKTILAMIKRRTRF